MSISHYVPHLKSPLLVVAFSPTAVLKVLPAFDPCRDTQDETAYRTWAFDFKSRVTQSLQQWMDKAGYEAGLLLRLLRDKADQWWYFLEHPQVPPDNNLAERNLRLAVTKRKVSGGSRSIDRFSQTADLLSVVQTCRRQGRSAIQFFKDSLMNKSGGEKNLPSLLPQTTT